MFTDDQREQFHDLLWRALEGSIGPEKVAALRNAPLNVLIGNKLAVEQNRPYRDPTVGDMIAYMAAKQAESTRRFQDISDALDSMEELQKMGYYADPTTEMRKEAAQRFQKEAAQRFQKEAAKRFQKEAAKRFQKEAQTNTPSNVGPDARAGALLGGGVGGALGALGGGLVGGVHGYEMNDDPWQAALGALLGAGAGGVAGGGLGAGLGALQGAAGGIVRDTAGKHLPQSNVGGSAAADAIIGGGMGAGHGALAGIPFGPAGVVGGGLGGGLLGAGTSYMHGGLRGYVRDKTSEHYDKLANLAGIKNIANKALDMGKKVYSNPIGQKAIQGAAVAAPAIAGGSYLINQASEEVDKKMLPAALAVGGGQLLGNVAGGVGGGLAQRLIGG